MEKEKNAIKTSDLVALHDPFSNKMDFLSSLLGFVLLMCLTSTRSNGEEGEFSSLDFSSFLRTDRSMFRGFFFFAKTADLQAHNASRMRRVVSL